MDQNQINQVNAKIAEIEQLGIDKLIAEIFKEQDINSIMLGSHTVPEYVAKLKRMLKQLKNELHINGIFLPFQYNYQNEYGSGNLSDDLLSIYNQINARTHNNLNKTTAWLNRLIYYQIANGFWDKTTRKVHNANEVKISELNNELHFFNEQLKANQNNFKLLLEELEKNKTELKNFTDQKKNELNQITTNLQTSNSNTNQIADLLNKSTATNEKINSLFSQQTQNFATQGKRIDEQEEIFNQQVEDFNKFKTEIRTNITTLENQITKFDEKLKFVESKKEFFEERNNYLEELIGREVGATLFETFKQRKGELEKPVNKWLWLVIGASILTFSAILVIFSLWSVTNGAPDYLRLITNTIKTLPFFFLLFYAIAQYNKERNFQEEYAFKSAVALTIKAYADLIVEDKQKDDLIMNAVNKVYKSPTIYKTKEIKDESNLLETVKELTSTVLELIKKKDNLS